MKETRHEMMDRLDIGAIVSGCLFLSFGISVMTVNGFSKWAPGIGSWLVIEGNQAAFIGFWMICIGIYAGWYCYLRRAAKLFPDLSVGLRVVAVFLVVILGAPALLATVSSFQPFWKWLWIFFLGAGLFVSVVVHAILKYRIQEEQRGNK